MQKQCKWIFMLIECRIAKRKSQTILKYVIEEFKYYIGKVMIYVNIYKALPKTDSF